MQRMTSRRCWNLIQAELEYSSNKKNCYVFMWESLLAIKVIVQAGRDEDEDFIKSFAFTKYCLAAGLKPNVTRLLFLKCIECLKNKEYKTLSRLLDGDN